MARTRTKRTKTRTAAAPPSPPRRRLKQLGLVAGILWCAYATVALSSYRPTDPAFSHASGGTAANVAGPVGAWTADLLHQLLGYCAWMVLPVGFALAWRLAGRVLGGTLRVLAAVTLVLTLACALEMLLSASDALSAYPAGGVVGLLGAETLRGLVGPAGAWIVLLGVVLAAGSFLVHLDFEGAAVRGVSLVETALPRVGRVGWTGTRWLLALVPAFFRGAWGVVTRLGRACLVATGWGAPRRPSAAASGENEQEWEDSEEWEDGEEWEDDELEGEGTSTDIDDPDYTDEAEELPGMEASDPGSPRPPVLVDPPLTNPRLFERPSVPDPTQVGQRALVEVEWDPTDAGLRSGRFDDDLTAPDPTRPGAPVRRTDAPHDPSDLPDPRFVPGGVSVVEPLEVDPGALEDEPEVVAPPPARRGASRGAGRRIDVTPAHLVSGGEDDGGVAVVAVDRAVPFEVPHLGLLDAHERDVAQVNEADLQALAGTLESKLADFGVTGQVTAIRPGPVITTFEYLPTAGIKIARIAALSDDIAMALKALRVRIVAPIPGKGVVGIEIPNKTRQTVWVRDLLGSEAFRAGGASLPLVLGRSVEGRPVVTDLSKMPHLLVGGTTGSGKSVSVNAMLLSLLYQRTPAELRLLLIDPKMLEFELYRDIPHLLHPVVTDVRLASAALKWACAEMDERYRILSRWQTRNIASYNQKVERESDDWTTEKALRYAPAEWPEGEPLPMPKRLPYIVIVIDELADLMMVAAKDVEESIIRIAQKARAAGIHLIVATQRPSVNVITGLIKANMPSRISFQVRTKVDSRTILDQNGAENLLGKGDMLYLPPGVSGLERIHGPFCSDEEVRRVTEFLKSQGEPEYEADIRSEDGENPVLDPDTYDELYDQAVAYVVQCGKASASMIQREFKIGYNRASRIIEIMERDGVVGPADGARPRDILVGQ